MFDAFGKVIGFFEVLFQYFINGISLMRDAFVMIGESLTLPFALVGFVPSIIGTSVLVFVSVFLVKFILGR